MILSKLILVGLFVTGVHTGGHLQQASDLGVRARLDIRTLTEIIKTDDPIKRRIIRGAGFNAQDVLSKHFKNTGLEDSYNLANAIYKIGYFVGAPKLFGLRVPDDLDKLGNSARMGVMISALSDLHRFKDPQTLVNVDFWRSIDGVPGLVSTIRF